jgi:hypothetical protein
MRLEAASRFKGAMPARASEPLPEAEKGSQEQVDTADQAKALWPREPLEVDLDNWIAGLSEAQRNAIMAALSPFLTRNPYINLLLLGRVKKGATTLRSNDFRECLEAYLQRAGFPTDRYLDNLVSKGQSKVFREKGLYEVVDKNQFEQDSVLSSLLEAGIIVDEGRRKYRIEPGVKRLIDLINEAKVEPGATSVPAT